MGAAPVTPEMRLPRLLRQGWDEIEGWVSDEDMMKDKVVVGLTDDE